MFVFVETQILLLRIYDRSLFNFHVGRTSFWVIFSISSGSWYGRMVNSLHEISVVTFLYF